jgi:hypothetical protein
MHHLPPRVDRRVPGDDVQRAIWHEARHGPGLIHQGQDRAFQDPHQFLRLLKRGDPRFELEQQSAAPVGDAERRGSVVARGW